MPTDQRFPIFPTRMNLGLTKIRLKSAQTGYSLLKRKSDALQKKHRDTLAFLDSKKAMLQKLMREAYINLKNAEFHGGNLNIYLQECKKLSCAVSADRELFSGVYLPKFKLEIPDRPVKFFGRGTDLLAECRLKWINILKLTIELVELQNSHYAMEEVLKSVNRRVNALEFMLIPKLENTIEFINSELDEQDREEFYRLKKVQGLQKDK